MVNISDVAGPVCCFHSPLPIADKGNWGSFNTMKYKMHSTTGTCDRMDQNNSRIQKTLP